MNDIMSSQENYGIPFEELLTKYQEFWKKFVNIPKYSPFLFWKKQLLLEKTYKNC